MNRRILLAPLLIVALTLFAAGCQPVTAVPEAGQATLTLVADGASQTLTVSDDYVVNDVLQLYDISLGSLDRVNPPGYSRVEDGMTITVVRVREETAIAEEVVPFRSRTVPNDGLVEGETRLLQPGVNGTAEITYRVTYEDGVEAARSEVRRVILQPPTDEIIMVGRDSDLPTVTVSGTLVYIYNGNAWLVQQNSANRRPLTVDGGLDGRVFELSADGRRLLYTRAEGSAETRPGAAFNGLWVVLDTADPEGQPLRLDLDNILYAAWLPGAERTILYSTAEPRDAFPGWQANNDLWRGQVTADGQVVARELLVEPWGGGVYGWYGTTFALSPDGVRLAWAQPDAVSVLLPLYEAADGQEPEEDVTPEPTPTPVEPAQLDPALLPSGYERHTLVTFAPWNAYDFVWVPSPAWSPDGQVLVTGVHGPPLGNERPEDSPAFPLVALPGDGSYSASLAARAGMWAEPRFSPAGSELAYLQADEPLQSVNGRYRLTLMDRDGSNRRALFPPPEQPGLSAQPYTWSPDGQQIALVNPGPEGALLLVDTATGLAQQVTDGQTSNPRWAP